MLEARRLVHELLVLLIGAEGHDSFHHGPAVPGPVEEQDLAGAGQVRDVALEVPLATFSLVRRGEGYDGGHSRVQVLHEPLDGSALAGRVTPLEQDDQPLARFGDPGLRLDQLDLLGASYSARVMRSS